MNSIHLSSYGSNTKSKYDSTTVHPREPMSLLGVTDKAMDGPKQSYPNMGNGFPVTMQMKPPFPSVPQTPPKPELMSN